MVLGILLLIVTVIILIVMFAVERIATAMSFLSICAVISCFVGLFIIYMSDQDTSKPTALDVYRGKTTLQITYQDSVAIDSVVVYKD